ncbi:DUF4282 domain-containing protein [Actinoallomurus oryzae]|uniref:DUF4282 domain-containing protein n=1 Tax=Actinoallomurus oryzae TaxID=502180 RepID=UPI003CD08C91
MASSPLVPPPSPYASPAPERRSLLGFLDVRFERRAGPALVRWLYLSALVMVAAVTVFSMLMSWWLASWAGWGFWLGVPISIATGLVWAVGVRLVCEQLIHWTGHEPPRRRAYATAPAAWSSPPSSAHPWGSGPGPTGEGGAPHRTNDLRR